MGEGSLFCWPRSHNLRLAIVINSLNSICAPRWNNPVFHNSNMTTPRRYPQCQGAGWWIGVGRTTDVLPNVLV
jgi:hypothetical protein